MFNPITFIIYQKFRDFCKGKNYILDVAGLNVGEEIAYSFDYYYLIYLVELLYLTSLELFKN